jgi:predicted  nucleic acid-binding Zn-ribbon protein
MIIEEAVERIKFLQQKIDNTLVIEKAADYQQEIDELIDEANRLSIDLTEYLEEYE